MLPPRHRRPRSPLLAAIATCCAALVLLVAGGSGTFSGWPSGVVTNSPNSTKSGEMAITHAYNSTSCSTTARMSSVNCSPDLGTAATPSAPRSDSITNNSTVAVNQSVTGVSCNPVQFANSKTSTDPMLPRNSVAFQQSGPTKWGTNTSAATFSSSGYATDAVGTGGGGLLGLLQGSFSFGVWFNASDTSGGGLMGLAASLSNQASATGNPMMWLDSAGHVRFVASSTLVSITGASSGTYTSGWHLAVLTVDTSSIPILGLTKSVTLYVDGASADTESGLTLLSNTSSGTWHLGWGDFTGVAAANIPTSRYFHGSLSGAFVNSSATLTLAQVTALYTATSASGYQSVATGQSGTASVWMLGDNGYTTYAGTSLPSGNIYDPCAKVNIAWAFTSPAATIAAQSLKAFANDTARSVAAPPIGGTQSLTVTTTQGSGYNVDLTGLHLYVPLSFTYTVSGATNWVQTLTWANDPLDVFWA